LDLGRTRALFDDQLASRTTGVTFGPERPLSLATPSEILGPIPADRGPVPIVVRSRRSSQDQVFRWVARAAGAGTFLVLVLIGIFLAVQAWPAFQKMGFAFFTTTGFQTKGTHPRFGVEAALFGTVTIALIALVVAIPVSIATALFISEYAPRTLFGFIPLKGFLTSVIDLMAAVPSVVYGLWGLLALQPHMAGLARWMSVHLSFIPIFSVPKGETTFTSSAFIAGVLVGIMVMPIVTSISREIFSLTPLGEREGAMALGASRARVIRDVVLPFGKGGLVGAIMLGLGRALGEAIAVTFIISLVYVNNFHILAAGSNSIAALIAAHFDSGGKLGLHALLACGLVLFFFTLAVNLIASWIVNRSRSLRHR
jgi:phosphate transport system permease protein